MFAKRLMRFALCEAGVPAGNMKQGDVKAFCSSASFTEGMPHYLAKTGIQRVILRPHFILGLGTETIKQELGANEHNISTLTSQEVCVCFFTYSLLIQSMALFLPSLVLRLDRAQSV